MFLFDFKQLQYTPIIEQQPTFDGDVLVGIHQAFSTKNDKKTKRVN